jgi:hypothetical protein
MVNATLGVDENKKYIVSIQETFANIKQAVEDGCTVILTGDGSALVGEPMTTFANLAWIQEDQLCFETIVEIFN